MVCGALCSLSLSSDVGKALPLPQAQMGFNRTLASTAAATGSILQKHLGFPPFPKGARGTKTEKHRADMEEHTSAWTKGHGSQTKS